MSDVDPISVTKRVARPPSSLAMKHIWEDRNRWEIEHLDFLTEVNLAHVIMLHERAIIASEVTNKLIAKLLEVAEKGLDALGPIQPSEGLYLAYEAALIDELGSQIGGSLHIGRSRNDLGSAIDRMVARRYLLEVLKELNAFRKSLLDRADKSLASVMTGYTHQQPGQPVTFAHWLLALENAFSRDFQRLVQAWATVDLCPLGACALAGTDFPIDVQRTADLLGFSQVNDNSLDAVAARDYVLESVSTLAIMATTVSRFATDLHLWSSDELALVTLPDTLAASSSIMPQKKNPVVLEWLKGRSARILADLQSVLVAHKNTTYSNTTEVNRESVQTFIPAVQVSAAMLQIASAVVHELKLNVEAMYSAAAHNFSTATLLANYLVHEHGLAFRTAYNIVGSTVTDALASGISAREISADSLIAKAHRVTGNHLAIDASHLEKILDPRGNVERLAFGGGPAPSQNGKVLATRNRRLAADIESVTTMNERITRSRDRLYAAARNLIQTDATEN